MPVPLSHGQRACFDFVKILYLECDEVTDLKVSILVHFHDKALVFTTLRHLEACRPVQTPVVIETASGHSY